MARRMPASVARSRSGRQPLVPPHPPPGRPRPRLGARRSRRPAGTLSPRPAPPSRGPAPARLRAHHGPAPHSPGRSPGSPPSAPRSGASLQSSSGPSRPPAEASSSERESNTTCRAFVPSAAGTGRAARCPAPVAARGDSALRNAERDRAEVALTAQITRRGSAPPPGPGAAAAAEEGGRATGRGWRKIQYDYIGQYQCLISMLRALQGYWPQKQTET